AADQHVQPAEAVDRALDGRLDLLAARHVAGEREALLAQRPRDLLRRRLVHVADGDRGAVAREDLARRGPDAATAPRDQGYLPIEPHASVPPCGGDSASSKRASAATAPWPSGRTSSGLTSSARSRGPRSSASSPI